MKRALLVLIGATVALCLFGCGPQNAQPAADSQDPAEQSTATDANEAEEAQEAASAPEFEVIESNSGKNMVSDGEHLFFCDHEDLYRSNLDLSEVVLLDDNCYPESLCLADGQLYYSTSNSCSGDLGIDGPAFEIRCIGTDGQDMHIATTSEHNLSSLSMWQGKLVFSDRYTVKIAEPELGGEVIEVALNDSYDTCIYCTVPCEDGIYFTATTDALNSDPTLYFCQLDGSEPSISKVADVGCCATFAVVDDDVYFLQESESSDDSDDSSGVRLVKLDAQGNIEDCGISGVLWGNDSPRLYAYGDYIFYSKYEPPVAGEQDAYIPYCYNTVTGQEAKVPGFDDPTNYTMLYDVAGGCAFIRDVSAGWGTKNQFLSLTNPNGCIPLETVVEGADDTIVTDRQAEEEAAAQAAAEEAAAAEAEQYADEPYGPGTSELHLSADDLSACYRLVRLDGTTEFMVVLAPGESTVQYFPSGRYRLKTAEGETWISDEEAFGPEGHYDTTDIFTFEDGGAYEIGSGESGDFHGEDQQGFLR